MIYNVFHNTLYRYSGAAAVCHSEARVYPRDHERQRVSQFDLRVFPPPDRVATRQDYFGNRVSSFSIREPHSQLEVTANSTVEVHPLPPVQADLSPNLWTALGHLSNPPDNDTQAALQFAYASPFVSPSRALAEYAKKVIPQWIPVLQGASDLCRQIHQDFEYRPAATTIETPLDEVFCGRKGVCQDFAHVMIGCLRSIGLPARYVSGYLRSAADYVGAEASHAWVAVFVPELGWFDFDPTNNIMPSEGHVTIAWGRDYSDVTPVKGFTLGGAEHQVEVTVRVEPAEIQPADLAI